MIIIIIEKFNHINNFELPTNNLNFIVGNDYNFKNDIIKALSIYFGNEKESTDYIEYNNTKLQILNKNNLINPKEYKFLKLDILKLDLHNEVELNKNSFFRETMDNYLQNNYIGTDLEVLVNSIIEDIFCDKEYHFINDISLKINLNPLTSKIIVEHLLNIEVKKNEQNIPIDYLTYFDKVNILLEEIKHLIDIYLKENKVILVIDNIDYKLTIEEIKKLYKKIQILSEYPDLYIYVFTNNILWIENQSILLKSVLININNSIVYFENYDDILLKIKENYPLVIEDENLDKLTTRTIVKNISSICNLCTLSDSEFNNLEEMTIIKIINDIFDFKYELNFLYEYSNNCYYSYLTSN